MAGERERELLLLAALSGASASAAIIHSCQLCSLFSHWQLANISVAGTARALDCFNVGCVLLLAE